MSVVESREQMDVDGVPYIDQVGQAAWIAEQTDLPLEVVGTVLRIEFEFMVGVGIVTSDPPGIEYEFLHYEPADFDGLRGSREVDTFRIAEDAERFTGIDAEVANRVFLSELDFLHMRGLV